MSQMYHDYRDLKRHHDQCEGAEGERGRPNEQQELNEEGEKGYHEANGNGGARREEEVVHTH